MPSTLDPAEELAGILDSIHSHGFKHIPEGGDENSRKVMAGKISGTWILEVPHHGDIAVGDRDTHSYFVSQVGNTTLVAVVAFFKVFSYTERDKVIPRVVAYFKCTDVAAAAEILEPLARSNRRPQDIDLDDDSTL